jgi:cyclic di-GMP phosphodiesterase Gmr
MCRRSDPEGLGDPCSFRELVDELPELVCRYTLDGVLTFVNLAYAEFLSETPASLVGRRIVDLVPAETVPALSVHLAALHRCTPEEPQRVNVSHVVSPDGELRWHQWTDKAVFEDGVIAGFVAIGRDVTEQVEAEALSRFRADHDSLTGLPNRRRTLDELERRADIAAAGGPQLGVVYLDLDDFKLVNDRYGHRFGDELLVEVAAELAVTIRSGDLVGRIGGDEFVVLANAATEHDVAALAHRIETLLLAKDPPVRTSVGWSGTWSSSDPGHLLHLADLSMYSAKLQRKGIDPTVPIPTAAASPSSPAALPTARRVAS